MEAHVLRKMLYDADGDVQIGVVVFANRYDYEMYKDDFVKCGYNSAVSDALGGHISTVSLQQVSFSKPKSPLVIPVVHCLTSNAKFSSALKKINDGGHKGPYMFLPSRKIYDFHS